MIRVVLDTNVLVSALLSPGRTADLIIRHWLNLDFVVCTTAEQIVEVSAVLIRPKLSKRTGVTDTEVARLIARLHQSRVDERTPAFLKEQVILSDPDDDTILAAALAGDADYIVSGDHHLLELHEFRGIPIVTPREFLEMLTEV